MPCSVLSNICAAESCEPSKVMQRIRLSSTVRGRATTVFLTVWCSKHSDFDNRVVRCGALRFDMNRRDTDSILLYVEKARQRERSRPTEQREARENDPWLPAGCPRIAPRFAYGVPMDLHGYRIGCTWVARGSPKDSPWVVGYPQVAREFPVGCSRTAHGLSVGCL